MSISEMFDDVNSGTGEEDTAPPAAEDAAEAQEPQEPQEPQDSPVAESTPAPTQEEQKVPLKALMDERERRQAAERERQQLQEILSRLTPPQQQQPPAERPNYADMLFTDTERFLSELYGQVNARISQVEQKAWQEKTAALEEVMRDLKPDYDELIENVFKPAAQRDNTLWQRMQSAANPAKFAYNEARKLRAAEEMGGDMDIARLKEKIRAEVLAELRGEGQKESGAAKGERLPVSLGTVGAGAPGTRTGPTKHGFRASDLY